jgi:hypothetical protein
MGYHRLCTKNPVSTLTHRSTRPFRSHCEGFFATKEACFYSKKSYKGTTFGAKPGIIQKSMSILAETTYRKSQLYLWKEAITSACDGREGYERSLLLGGQLTRILECLKEIKTLVKIKTLAQINPVLYLY